MLSWWVMGASRPGSLPAFCKVAEFSVFVVRASVSCDCKDLCVVQPCTGASALVWSLPLRVNRAIAYLASVLLKSSGSGPAALPVHASQDMNQEATPLAGREILGQSQARADACTNLLRRSSRSFWWEPTSLKAVWGELLPCKTQAVHPAAGKGVAGTSREAAVAGRPSLGMGSGSSILPRQRGQAGPPPGQANPPTAERVNVASRRC